MPVIFPWIPDVFGKTQQHDNITENISTNLAYNLRLIFTERIFEVVEDIKRINLQSLSSNFKLNIVGCIFSILYNYVHISSSVISKPPQIDTDQTLDPTHPTYNTTINHSWTLLDTLLMATICNIVHTITHYSFLWDPIHIRYFSNFTLDSVVNNFVSIQQKYWFERLFHTCSKMMNQLFSIMFCIKLYKTNVWMSRT